MAQWAILEPWQPEDGPMKWETPTYQDLRFGFEVTMYIANR
jgi:pyrroloquinoline quinone biosynthesis protein A